MRRFDVRLLILLAAVLVAALVLISYRTVGVAERVLVPELDRKATAVVESLADLLDYALSKQIPFDRLVGVDDSLRQLLEDNPEFESAQVTAADGSRHWAALRAADGSILVGQGQFTGGTSIAVTAPLQLNGQTVGQAVVTVPTAVAEHTVERLWLDIGVVLLVSVLVTLELLSFVFALDVGKQLRGLARRLEAVRHGDLRPMEPSSGGGPLARVNAALDRRLDRLRARHAELHALAQANEAEPVRQRLLHLEDQYRLTLRRSDPPGSLTTLRTPVFLFFFAEELTRPFLPSFINSLVTDDSGLSREMLVSLPIVLFMAIVALAQPFLNGITERLGRAMSLRIGAALGVGGFLATAYAGDVTQLMLGRSATAVGYAFVFVAAQGYIIDRTGPANRGRGLAILVGAIMVAALCGPPIGGILADRLGIRTAFLVSAGLAVFSLLCARLSLEGATSRGERSPPFRFRNLGAALSKPQIALLLFGCALPAKMMLAALCFFLVPLTLADNGFDKADIGRVLMLYALAMLLVVPQVARWSDRVGQRPRFVILGGLIAGVGVMHLSLWPEPWASGLLVLQLGVAQAFSIAPQSALIGELGARYLPELREGALYGVFRLTERAGNAIGPALAAWLLASYGAETAALVIATIVTLGAFAYALVSGNAAGAARAAPRQQVGKP